MNWTMLCLLAAGEVSSCDTDVFALFPCGEGCLVGTAAGTARQEAPAPGEELVLPPPPPIWPTQLQPPAIRAGSQCKRSGGKGAPFQGLWVPALWIFLWRYLTKVFFSSYTCGICLFITFSFANSEVWDLTTYYSCSGFLHYYLSKFCWLKTNGA